MIKEINNGVYPTMLTPFTDDNKIDYNGVLQLLDFYKNRESAAFSQSASQAKSFFFQLKTFVH